MFAFRRGRLPLLVPLGLAVAFGYLLAGGIGSALGALLFLPFLIMKVVFMMLFFGFVFRMFAHRAGDPFGHGRHRWHHGPDPDTRSEQRPEPDREDRDWEEALRAAKREIDKLFPNPDDNTPDRER